MHRTLTAETRRDPATTATTRASTRRTAATPDSRAQTKGYSAKQLRKAKLVKIYDQRIVKDYTEDQQHCPQCGEQFAREAMVHGRLAYKVINGKVSMK